jgi:phage gpG-like protein
MPGGTMVTFQISGHAPLRIEIERFKHRLNDVEPVWQAIADRMAEVWGREFRLEGAWVRWAPLSPRYREWKAKRYPGAKIMHLTGDLEDSLTKRPFGIDEINNEVMVIGTQVFYAGYHHHGTPMMPARPVLRPIKRQDAKLFGKYLHQFLHHGKVSRRGNE